jgi:8-oxo-dGTP pyrophosphatase MutT (NUDIX family)
MLTIQAIDGAINGRTHEPATFMPAPHHAAVAMILADGATGLEACFIRRAERDSDPWSGQVAFPGGRASAGDSHALDVAQRETREEIGLTITAQDYLGPLPIHELSRGGRAMTLSPFVYYVAPDRNRQMPQQVATAYQPTEVASVFWVPLEHLFDKRSRTTLDYPQGGALTEFPGIGFGDHVIWGLTLRVLGTFADLVRRPLATRE